MADQAKKTVGQYVDWIGNYVEAALEDINNLRQQQAAGEEGLGATACDRQCRVFACAPALCKCVRRLSPGPVMGGLIPVVQVFLLPPIYSFSVSRGAESMCAGSAVAHSTGCTRVADGTD